MASLTILRKQPTFRDASNSFPAKWHLRNERRNSILMTCHYPDLVSVSNWLKQFSQAVRLIRSTTQIWVVTRHQYRISALVSQTSFRWETVGGVAKCDNLKKFETRAFYSFFTAPDRTTLNLCGPPAVGGLLGPKRSWTCKWPAKLGETAVRSLSDNKVRHPCCILRHSILWSKEERYLECMTSYWCLKVILLGSPRITKNHWEV